MADKKITDLTELTEVASDDYLEIVDTSANTSKKISRENLIAGHDHGSLSGLGDNDHPQYVLMSGDQTVAGVKTFSSFPVTPSSAPSSNYQVSNKKYVDDLIGAWQSYTVSWTAATTNPSIGNGTLAGRYVQIGKTVICNITLVMGSTTTYGSGKWMFSLPVTAKSSGLTYLGKWVIVDAGTTYYEGNLILYSAGSNVEFFIRNQNAADEFNSTTPISWAENDQLMISIVYERGYYAMQN